MVNFVKFHTDPDLKDFVKQEKSEIEGEVHHWLWGDGRPVAPGCQRECDFKI